jgi:hypothetical protein
VHRGFNGGRCVITGGGRKLFVRQSRQAMPLSFPQKNVPLSVFLFPTLFLFPLFLTACKAKGYGQAAGESRK